MAPALPPHAGIRLDERPQWHVLQGRRLASLFPAQPLRFAVGEHVVGPLHLNRPRELDFPGRRHTARRPWHHLQRLLGGGQRQHRRLRQGCRGGLLHVGGKGAEAEHGGEHRQRHDLREACRQPRARVEDTRLPRPAHHLACRHGEVDSHSLGEATHEALLFHGLERLEV